MTAPNAIADVDAALAGYGLCVTGAFHAGGSEDVPAETATLCLLGPADGRMWDAFAAAPEVADGEPDPLDRWSRRVIDAAAEALGARALYPFGGPPWAPFLTWAARAEGAVSSPIGMSVTPARGLHASWRGALAFAVRLAGVASPSPPPCGGCARPCVTACPVDAFAAGRYDVDACVAHVTRPEGARCREDGCLARRACPVSMDLPRAQRAFHLDAFIAARRGA